jgi:anti-sigma factor RsiW
MELISLMCERARRWSSLAVDDELSQLESRLLAVHLESCSSCREFAADLRGIAGTLRTATLEPSFGVRLPARVRKPRVGIAVVVAVASLLLLAFAAGAAAIEGRAGDVRATKPIAMVSGVETPNELRRLRRDSLIHHNAVVTYPRNRLLSTESF